MRVRDQHQGDDVLKLYKAVIVATPISVILYLTDLNPLFRWAAYIILAILITAMLSKIFIPLILVAMHTPPPGRSRELGKQMWSENKYMMITLGVQSALSFISIIIHIADQSNLTMGLILFLIDTYLTARLVAECYTVMRRDTMMAVAALLLGLSIYLLYSLTLLSGLV